MSQAPLSFEEVSRFHERQRQVKAADEAYLAAYPEVRTMLTDFTVAVLQEQPQDIVTFAADFFARYTPTEDDKGVVVADTGKGEVATAVVAAGSGPGSRGGSRGIVAALIAGARASAGEEDGDEEEENVDDEGVVGVAGGEGEGGDDEEGDEASAS